jgi:hypothetical protein
MFGCDGQILRPNPVLSGARATFAVRTSLFGNMPIHPSRSMHVSNNQGGEQNQRGDSGNYDPQRQSEAGRGGGQQGQGSSSQNTGDGRQEQQEGSNEKESRQNQGQTS